jgi:DNA ligase D-like protein (predicted 3'-phosphoesterase)
MKKESENPIFVIQKHKAAHLHYDFRLESKGVLKSWAVPKEPPVEENVKRLAIQVEDHKLGYEKFEGEIPKGEYGAGTVEIWDRGSFMPLKFNSKEIIIELKGNKLNGIYCLIKLKPNILKDKNWLFFRKKQ